MAVESETVPGGTLIQAHLKEEWQSLGRVGKHKRFPTREDNLGRVFTEEVDGGRERHLIGLLLRNMQGNNNGKIAME